jgi:hypothetical protein
MCIICIEMDKNTLSPWEARRNLSEMVEKIGHDHAREVDKKISDAIFEEISLNFGETLQQTCEFCEFCECDPCDCNYGE